MEEHETARREVKKIKKRVIQQRDKVKKSSKNSSKRHISDRDHDAKAKKDLGRLTGKDAVEGRIYKRFKTKLERAEKHQDSIKYRKSYTMGIQFQGEDSFRFFPLTVSTASLSLGAKKTLKIPELIIQYGDKIGLFGKNGSGKTSFLQYLIADSKLPGDKLIYIPQEIPADQSRSMIRRIRNYSREKLGKMMILVSRLGSDPHRVLETDIPSPGEVRKLMLAEGILKNPGIIILDEPTNHMDLPSVECVELALKECPCTQLLVSHDRVFLTNTTNQFWIFSQIEDNEFYINSRLSMDG
jgi:ATPase subunit of ABC transporter with duplicated ATPase domains